MTPEEAWVPTYSGKRFYPLEPRIAAIRIEDIAHALSLTCRYAGQVKFHYSVGHHSLLVSKMVPHEIALEALMHDASEAYLSDISRDVKMLMPEYKEWENRLEAAIAMRFGLHYPWHPSIKEADTAILAREGAWLFPKDSDMWKAWGVTSKAGHQEIYPLEPRTVELGFLRRFDELYSERHRLFTEGQG